MAIVTGILSSYARLPMYGLSPVIEFHPTGPSTQVFGSVIFASKTITATPSEVDGSWSVDLASTRDLLPATWYEVVVVWLDSAGNYVAKDFMPGRLYVPTTGGAFADLFRVGGNPLLVWIDSGAPTPPPSAVPGDLVFDPTTDNLYQVN